MRRVLSDLRENEDVRSVLGDAVRPEPAWYLNGSPWVYGSVRGAPLSPAYTPQIHQPLSFPSSPSDVCGKRTERGVWNNKEGGGGGHDFNDYSSDR
jgi:hypothetical protein